MDRRPVRCTSVQVRGYSRRRRRTGSHRGRTVLSGFPAGWEPPGSHTIGARTPPNATADLLGGPERSTPGWPVSGAEPGCGPTLASNDAARPTLGVATTGGVARAGHDRTQRRARSLTIDVVGGAGVNCLLVFTFRGITSVARQRFSSEKTRCDASAGDGSGVDRRLLLAASDLDAPRL